MIGAENNVNLNSVEYIGSIGLVFLMVCYKDLYYIFDIPIYLTGGASYCWICDDTDGEEQQTECVCGPVITGLAQIRRCVDAGHS